MEELKERLGRMKRLMENDDLTKTIAELDEMFAVDGSVFVACNCPNAAEYLFAREGMRTYRNKLMGLAKETEDQIKLAQTEENIDE